MPEPAKKKPFSSTAATLKWARGVYGDANVENASHWQAWKGQVGGVRKDLWGFQDCQALDGLPGVLALQACGGDVGAHKRKMEEPELSVKVARWLEAGNRLLIVAWREVWVQTSARHKIRKRVPRFLSASLDAEGISFHGHAPLRWTEHETWPITAKEVAPGNQTCTELATAPPEAKASGGSLEPQPKLFEET